MSNAPVATAPAASVALPNGTVISSNMSPTERFNAVALSVGAPAAERPAGIVFGPKGLTPATANEFARRDAQAAKAAPPAAPAKVVAPPQGTPAERASNPVAFTPPAPATVSAEVDQSAVDALNKVWRTFAPEQREEKRATYEHDLKTIFEGRKLGESVAQFEARKAGAVPAQAVAPDPKTFTPAEWEDGHKSVADKDGWIPVDRVNPTGLSGYTLPRLVEGQQYHRSIFAELANARAAGLSQEAVTNYIKAQMTRDGFLK